MTKYRWMDEILPRSVEGLNNALCVGCMFHEEVDNEREAHCTDQGTASGRCDDVNKIAIPRTKKGMDEYQALKTYYKLTGVIK